VSCWSHVKVVLESAVDILNLQKRKLACTSAKAGASFDDDEGRRRAPKQDVSHARHITRRYLCLASLVRCFQYTVTKLGAQKCSKLTHLNGASSFGQLVTIC
jgi:hypothetical protein